MHPGKSAMAKGRRLQSALLVAGRGVNPVGLSGGSAPV